MPIRWKHQTHSSFSNLNRPHSFSSLCLVALFRYLLHSHRRSLLVHSIQRHTERLRNSTQRFVVGCCCAYDIGLSAGNRIWHARLHCCQTKPRAESYSIVLLLPGWCGVFAFLLWLIFCTHILTLFVFFEWNLAWDIGFSVYEQERIWNARLPCCQRKPRTES